MFNTAIYSGMAVFFNLLMEIFLRKIAGKKIEERGTLIKWRGILPVIAVSIGMGAWLYEGATGTAERIRHFCRDGGSYELYGCIKGMDERSESGRTYILLEDIRIEDSGNSMKINGKIQLVFEGTSELLKQGRYIRLTGTYAEFKEPRNEGSFDSQTYYYSMGIYGNFYAKPKDIQWVKRKYSLFRNGLTEIRKDMRNRLYEMTDEKYASILAGILLGCKTEIDTDTKELYQLAGISHLLSISGLHISMIGMCVYRLLRKRFRFVISGMTASFFVLSYGIMTGYGISAKRAVIMFMLGLLAEITGRTYDILSALSFAAILIVAEMPLAPESATMQLSFGAILGIALVGRKVTIFLNTKSKTTQTVVVSACINLITRPVISFNYYQTAFYSTLINPVVIPVFSIVLWVGIVCIFLSYLCVEISRYMILLPVGILKLYEIICQGYERIPGAVQITGKPSASVLFIYYGIVGMSVLSLWLWERRGYGRQAGENRENNREEFWYIRFVKKIIVITIFFLLNLLIFYGYDRETCIKMLDVGQGDSIYIGTEQGINILIDAGSSSNSKIAEYEILPFLKANAVKNLSYLIMTHSDKDHISGMIPLLTVRYQNRPYVKCLVLPDISENVRDESYNQLEETAVKNGVKILYLSAGMEIVGKNIRISCIYPSKEVTFRDKNELSLNCILSIGGITVMFTGDLETQGENYLLQSGILGKCDILKVAHHGSNGSSGEEYLRRIQPDTALISCSENNRYGHPGKETLSRLEALGSKVYITGDCGQITIRIGKKGVYCVERFRD